MYTTTSPQGIIATMKLLQTAVQPLVATDFALNLAPTFGIHHGNISLKAEVKPDTSS